MAAPQLGSRRGFTLVEIALVIVIVGMLIGIAVPRFTAMRNGLQLDTAAHQLAGELRRAQIEAVKRNKTIRVVKTGTSTYDVESLTPAVTVLYSRSFEPGVGFTAGAMTVSFPSFGPPIGGGAAFPITFGGRTKTVTVGANGIITVQ
jgi:prepilin-type N-terminal cleavage/methylation domain-containing protein